nr:hypothetical protein CFP56_52918 [Quercus suber]
MQRIFRMMLREYFFARRVAQFKRGLEGTKHQKFLANTAITKDLVQPKRIYGGLDARLALEVIPCKMRPGTAWNMSLNNNGKSYKRINHGVKCIIFHHQYPLKLFSKSDTANNIKYSMQERLSMSIVAYFTFEVELLRCYEGRLGKTRRCYVISQEGIS